MNKKQFLKRLKHELRGLPGEEIEASLRYYDEAVSEHIEHGKTETEAVEAVGSPEDAAGRILAELPDEITDQMIRNRNVWRKIAVPAFIIGLPVWIALVAAGIAVVIALAAVYLAVIISIFAAAIALFTAAIPGAYLVIVSGSIANSLLCISAILACGGMGILCMIIAILLTKAGIRGIKSVFHIKRRKAVRS